MKLENITGNLKDAYRQLVPGTMLHVDQLTTERRTNYDLQKDFFYTADGELYTANVGKVLWGITREPQNLVLQNIDVAYHALIDNGNYFPLLEEAGSSFEHPHTVVIDVRGLSLIKNNDEHGYFVVDPKKVTKLNSQQRLAAQRIYGPDEDNFRQNMEMFAEAEMEPRVFVLMPDYVQRTLHQKDSGFVARASWLSNFSGNSRFSANVRDINYRDRVRGVRRGVVAEGGAQKNQGPYREPAFTPEQLFDLKVDEALSRFDEYIGRGDFIQKRYEQDKLEAKKLLALYFKK
jgi:hypothetical protein